MKFSIKAKLGLLVIGCLLGLGLTLTGRSLNLFHKDKIAFLEELTTTITSNSVHSVMDRSHQWRNHLRAAIQRPDLLREDSTRNLPASSFGDFLAIGLFEPAGNGEWKLRWMERGPRLEVQTWPADYELSLVSPEGLRQPLEPEHVEYGFAEGKSRDQYVVLLTMASPSSSLQVEGNLKAFGILAIKEFESLSQSLKGALPELFVFDMGGRIYSHPSPSRIGAIAKNDPLVEKITVENRSAYQGQYSSEKQGESLGIVEPVQGTNLFVASHVALAEAFGVSGDLMLGSTAWIIFFLLVAVALVIYFSNRWIAALESLRGQVTAMNEGELGSQPLVNTSDEVGTLTKEIEKLRGELAQKVETFHQSEEGLYTRAEELVFQRVSQALSEQLKNPLTTLLGHAQLILSKLRADPDFKRSIEMIEDCSRSLRETLERFEKSTQIKNLDFKKASLEFLVRQSLEQLDGQGILKGVKVHKNFYLSEEIPLCRGPLQQALNVLIRDIVERRSGALHDLVVHIEPSDVEVFLRIQDPTWVLSDSELKNYFKPWEQFQAENSSHLFNLTYFKAVIEVHQGEVQIESSEQKGTTVTVTFPKVRKVVITPAQKAKLTVRSGSAPSVEPEVQSMQMAEVETVKAEVLNPPRVPEMPPQFKMDGDEDEEMYPAWVEHPVKKNFEFRG